MGRREGGRMLVRAEEEDNFISFWGGELSQERLGKVGTPAGWVWQR